MKNILLLGDSIRQNYQNYVKEKLADVAQVRFPNDNGKFCQLTLRYVYEWIRALRVDGQDFDIVHFNCGLWDVLRLSNEDRTFTDKEQYAELLLRIVDRIRYCCPKAKIIFALSTSVIEPGFEPGEAVASRRNLDIQEFNEIAKQSLMGKVDYINDLWEISVKLPKEAHSDDVHYETKIGIAALGGKVTETLRMFF